MVNFKGIPKHKVLQALYDNARAQGLGFLHYTPAPMSEEEAKSLLGEQTYFDYVNGRVMKVDLRGDEEFLEHLYDRDNGPGAAARAIESLRETSE